MDDYVSFEVAKKLKEKSYPMTEIPTGGRDKRNAPVLYDLPKEHPNWQDCKAWWGPPISQVLKWLREKYFIHISTKPYPCEDGIMWLYEIRKFSEYISYVVANKTGFIKEEQATLAGIEYVLDNLI